MFNAACARRPSAAGAAQPQFNLLVTGNIMGQQLRKRVKRQRRKNWIERKKHAAKPAAPQKPA